MVAVSPCLTSVRCVRVRITELDPATRAPVLGAGHGYVASSQVLLTVETENEPGETFEARDGSGLICDSAKTADTFKSVGLTLQVCNLDPYIERFLLGSALIVDGTDTIGAQAPPANLGVGAAVCLEVWSRAWSGSSQAVTPTTAPSVAFHHWVFPYAHGFAPESTTIDSGIHLFSYSGIGEESSEVTTTGPYDDWPAAVTTSGGISRAYAHFLDAAIPSATCATITVTGTTPTPPAIDGGYQGGYPEGY